MAVPNRDYASVSPDEAERLVRDGAARVLDVRTPEEYRDLGHIPGAILLPVDLVASGLATLPRDGKPLLVCCEHGIRSAAAARLLGRGGFPNLLNLGGGMAAWRGEREFSAGDPFTEMGPSSWLVLNADLLPAGGKVLDVACGSGRNALLLAVAGFTVKAVDRDESKIGRLRDIATKLGVDLEGETRDLEQGEADLGSEEYDLVVVFRYLHRPLFPALIRAVKKDGLLLYETFTRAQAARGGPSRPEFLLEPGELKERLGALQLIREREGEFDGRMVAGIAARRA